MNRYLMAAAMFVAVAAMGCTNDEIDATPSALSFAARACMLPDYAPTPELAALVEDVDDYSTNALQVVAGTIEACTSLAEDLGVDLGDRSLFLATEEWYGKAASELRRRCSAIEAPLRAAGPVTMEVEHLGCEAPEPCVDPLVARERCQLRRVDVIFGGERLLPGSPFHGLLYYLPNVVRSVKAPEEPPAQTYAPSPRATLCDQTIRQSVTEATSRWAPALAAAAEAFDAIALATRVQTTCEAYPVPRKR